MTATVSTHRTACLGSLGGKLATATGSCSCKWLILHPLSLKPSKYINHSLPEVGCPRPHCSGIREWVLIPLSFGSMPNGSSILDLGLVLIEPWRLRSHRSCTTHNRWPMGTLHRASSRSIWGLRLGMPTVLRQTQRDILPEAPAVDAGLESPHKDLLLPKVLESAPDVLIVGTEKIPEEDVTLLRRRLPLRAGRSLRRKIQIPLRKDAAPKGREELSRDAVTRWSLRPYRTSRSDAVGRCLIDGKHHGNLGHQRRHPPVLPCPIPRPAVGNPQLLAASLRLQGLRLNARQRSARVECIYQHAPPCGPGSSQRALPETPPL
jgi:hypothetical protein